MKKYLTLLIILVLCMSLAACKKDDSEVDENTTPTPTPQALIYQKEGRNIITGYKSGDVKLGQYTGLTYKPLSTEPTEEEIQASLDSFVNNYKTKTEITDRDTVENGDVVDIDFVGKKDGVAFDTGTGSKEDLVIGSEVTVPGFEEAIIGKQKGTFTIEVTFPEDYKNKDLAGALVTFDVTLKGIYKYEYPELTDEFVAEKTNNNYTTVAAYKEYVKSLLKNQKEQEAEMQKEYDIVEKLIENTTYNFDIESEIERGVSSLKSYYDSLSLSQYGMDAAGYYATIGLSTEQFEAMLRAEAELSVRYEYARSAIAEAERFELTDKEIEDIARKQMYTFGYTDLDEFYKLVESTNGVDAKTYFVEMAKLDKAGNLVMETAIADETLPDKTE